MDTFSPESAVVVADHGATRAEILEQLEVLINAAGEEHFVFIAYAGHGSDDFFLIPHDADPADFASTAITLDALIDLFASIPCKRAMLVLDCCFSGAAGARVFHHGFATRSFESVEQGLARIVDNERIVTFRLYTTVERGTWAAVRASCGGDRLHPPRELHQCVSCAR